MCALICIIVQCSTIYGSTILAVDVYNYYAVDDLCLHVQTRPVVTRAHEQKVHAYAWCAVRHGYDGQQNTLFVTLVDRVT